MKYNMDGVKNKKVISGMILGEDSPDTVITNGTIFNVFTREFIDQQSIWIEDGVITYIGPYHDFPKKEDMLVIDAHDMVLLPGLIDGHTHLSRSGIEEYIRYVIPSGVTTVVMEAIEFGTIAGKEGIEYFVRGLKDQPIRFYYTLPPLCGLTPSEEINAPLNEEVLHLLKDPKCLGVGEIYWGNIFLEGQQGERVRELASLALSLGKQVEGHTAGATGRKLQAYTCFGASSDHEPITEDEVMERLRLGYWVMIREGAIRKELSGVKGIFQEKIDFRRLILSTDGVDPEGFLEEGYLDASLKRMMELRVPPSLAYQMVTINVAEHFHLDHLIGSLSIGKIADIVIIPSHKEFSPQLVMCNGKIIFKDGRAMVEPQKVTFPDHMFNTVRIPGLAFPQIPRQGKARVIEFVTRLVTKEKIIDLSAPEEIQDVIMVMAIDRLGSGKAFTGFLKGFGLQRGSYGTTMAWDTPDMIVVGSDTKSIETVIERLKGIRGGGVYAIGSEVVAEFPAPLCGVYSLKSMETVREEIKKLEESLCENGVKWEKPVLTIDTLGSPAIPHLRITHNGYVNLKDRKILSLDIL
jgi:adenine deaminase